jgi:hypothetical protein
VVAKRPNHTSGAQNVQIGQILGQFGYLDSPVQISKKPNLWGIWRCLDSVRIMSSNGKNGATGPVSAARWRAGFDKMSVRRIF